MASAQPTGESVADKYSLLPQMMPHFDRHLLYPLLNFPPPAEDDEQPIEKQKVLFELLKPTYMTGYVGQLAQNINNLDQVPEEYLQKQDQEKKRLAQLEEATSKLMELLSDEAVLASLRSDKQQNLAYLEKEHGVTVQIVEQLYEEAQFKYGCGLYGDAADLLTRYRILVRLSFFHILAFRTMCCWSSVCILMCACLDDRQRQGARGHLGKACLRNSVHRMGVCYCRNRED